MVVVVGLAHDRLGEQRRLSTVRPANSRSLERLGSGLSQLQLWRFVAVLSFFCGEGHPERVLRPRRRQGRHCD